jgi:hypothetical protein
MPEDVDKKIVEGLTNSLLLIGPLAKMIANIFTPETTQLLQEIVRDKDFKESVANLLNATDPSVLALLLPVIGAVLGAIITEIGKDEQARKAFIGILSSSAVLMKQITSLLMGKTE